MAPLLHYSGEKGKQEHVSHKKKQCSGPPDDYVMPGHAGTIITHFSSLMLLW